jgi:hypothetical protein
VIARERREPGEERRSPSQCRFRCGLRAIKGLAGNATERRARIGVLCGQSSGGVIALYDSDTVDAVDQALPNAVKKSVAHIDGMSAKDLKARPAEAQAGMGGRLLRDSNGGCS